jgi:hypothetical protein
VTVERIAKTRIAAQHENEKPLRSPSRSTGLDAPFSSTGTGESSAATKRSSKDQKQELKDVIIFQLDGTQLVAVQRTDLSLGDPKARAIAMADNRTAEIGLEWYPTLTFSVSYQPT